MNDHLDRAELEVVAARGDSHLSAEKQAHLSRCPHCQALRSNIGRTLNERPVAAPPPLPERPQSETASSLARGTSVGRYLILELLGQGGMGSVYAAYDAELNRKVAVKVLRPDASQSVSREGQLRLLREAQAMARIAHPNVIAVYDVGTVGDGVFVAMELVDGGTMKQWLREKTRTPREILDAFLQAGRGLLAAHRAGLIHRDFKPENVLVGTDGRFHVTDFGLARLASGEDTDPSDGWRQADPDYDGPMASALASSLTRTGTVMGTPRYMSPEQHLGKAPDATSDQFSFCAALYWALFGERPFEPQALAAAAIQGTQSSGTAPVEERASPSPVREPPKDAKVSVAVRKAVMRGLSLSARDRFPSLEPLLAVLEAQPRRRLPLAMAGAAVLALTSVVGWVGFHARQQQRAVCSGGPAKLVGAWDASVRATVEKAFRATGGARAEDALGKVEASLDRYAALWTGEYHDACAATALRKEQPESVLAVRMVCLDRARAELQALTRLMSSADAKLVKLAPQAVGDLSAPQECANIASLSRIQPLPSDPARRAQIRSIQDAVSAARALKLAGHFSDARQQLDQLITRAEPLAYPPLTAEALYLKGALLDQSSPYPEEQKLLTRAFDAADAGAADELRAQIASELTFVAAQAMRFEDGLRWSRAAQAVLHRLGGHAALESAVLNDVGTLYMNQQEYAKAADAFTSAIAKLSTEPRANPIELANFKSNLALADAYLWRLPEAKKLIDESIATYLGAFDPDNIALADRYNKQSEVFLRMGDMDAAAQAVTHALDITRRVRGDTDLSLATLYDGRATIYQTAGHYPQARADYLAGLAIRKQHVPTEDSDFAYSYGGVGQCLVEEGKDAEAVSWLEKALAIPLPDRQERGNSHFALARALWTSTPAARERAKALAKDAIDDFKHADDAKSRARAEAWLGTREGRSKPKR